MFDDGINFERFLHPKHETQIVSALQPNITNCDVINVVLKRIVLMSLVVNLEKIVLDKSTEKHVIKEILNGHK